ncbi:Glucose 1-dehydrogenase [Caenispirillum salinarum AK4]|uniref:Glucose 1-dehydrogenase n=1 Tax=Caenispirillum salinarum AK4 TaxID=1238182 RepID=K9HHU6_9PROT|nr:glucose 1-dehydrogenase [Caenispirillum salinarum]EKV30013.1 Glucose 1-dehydrogenase [Caenispirillum salinarum AK4]
MSDRLRDQAAIVTGGSSGIGKASAIALGREGAAVTVVYHGNREGGEEAAHAIEQAGGRAQVLQGNVAEEGDVTEIVSRTRSEFGTVDILLSNSGIQKDADFLDMSLKDWQAVISVNLTGQFLCARECLKVMCAQGVREGVSKAAGKVICMSSVHQFIPWAGHVNYAAAKGGVHLLAESIAQEFAPRKIRVNTLAPGAIKTAINEDVWQSEEGREKLMGMIPYQRIGEPEDVAEAVVWLASDDSDYITGATLVIDGGMKLYPSFREGG